MHFVDHLEELRHRILAWLAVLAAATLGSWFFGMRLMKMVQAPIRRLEGKLIYIDPTEAFGAYMKIVLLAAFMVSLPFMLYQAWAFLSPAFEKRTNRRMVLWLGMMLILFAAGVLFSYFVLIPAALGFLIQFGQGMAEAQITMERYVAFFVMLILAGGLVFEIPVAMAFLADLGLVKVQMIKKQRAVAFVLILIASAVITPTQDVINMMILAVPIYLLFEIGIMIAGWLEHHRLKNYKSQNPNTKQ